MGRECKKCGRPLDRDDVDCCKVCFEEVNEESYSEYQNKIQEEKEWSYTNTVASDFKDWSRNVSLLGFIFAIVVAICGFVTDSVLICLVSAVMIYCAFNAVSLMLVAVAEIIQKLQNIEDNTKK